MSMFSIIARSMLAREILYKTRNNKSKIEVNEKEFKKLKIKLDKHKKTIKYTRSIPIMVKNFDTIKTVIEKMIKLSSEVCFEIEDKIIDNANDICKIDIIKKEWIKNFIEKEIDIEISIIDYLSQPFLKESQVKKALNFAIKGIRYLPDDLDIQERITELEGKLLSCYEED